MIWALGYIAVGVLLIAGLLAADGLNERVEEKLFCVLFGVFWPLGIIAVLFVGLHEIRTTKKQAIEREPKLHVIKLVANLEKLNLIKFQTMLDTNRRTHAWKVSSYLSIKRTTSSKS